MNTQVRLYDLAPSPHNIKVRLALGYKKIPYEKIPVDPEKREVVIKASGQPLTPVLLHGDTVVFDSYAILRYLDANWPTPPRLFSPDRQTMQRIEEWEMFARLEVGPAIRLTFREYFAAQPDAAKLREADRMMNRVAGRLEETLAKAPCLMGEAPNAADLSIAPMVYYGAVPEAAEKGNPIAAHFRRHIRIKGAPKTLDWVARLMALDR